MSRVHPLLGAGMLFGAGGSLQALASEPGRCALAEVHLALAGEAPASHPAMLEAPARLFTPEGHHLPLPPAPVKEVYGGNYEFHLETENFTLNWWDSGISQAHAQLAADALETAWSSLVEEQGWQAPVSSDRYYIWVLLDRSLGSTTGYTTEYFTDEYPDGYPVIYLNPDQFWQESFWQALAAHEFMHTVQYAMRAWDEGGAEESWYWEASANHASELADPGWDGHQYTSAWYTLFPELRYDSYEGGHQYGMFVLNAWLEEQGTGLMQETWELGVGREDLGWDELLASASSREISEIWGGFSAAVANEELPESPLYTEVKVEGVAEPGTTGVLPRLGTHVWRVTTDIRLEATGEVVLGGPDGQVGGVIELLAGEKITVTGLDDDATYELFEAEPATQDTGSADDTGSGGESSGGGASGGGGVGGDDAAGDDAAGDEDDDHGVIEPSGCGCSSGRGQAHHLGWVLLGGMLLLARRQTG